MQHLLESLQLQNESRAAFANASEQKEFCMFDLWIENEFEE